MFESIVQLCFEIGHEGIGCIRGVRIKVVQEFGCKVCILSHLIVEVLHPLLTHFVLFLDIILHVFRLVPNLLHNLFFISYSCLLFLYQSVLDPFELLSDWVQMVIVVFDSVLAFLVDASLSFVHSSMVFGPLLPKYLTLIINLFFQIVSKFL